MGAELRSHTDSLFRGKISARASDSVPDWPSLVNAPAGAPNVVLILLDDVGFGDTSTFGGLADTLALDRLAGQGLRYNNFNTVAKCSPTRAALLTGRNHHRVGFGDVPDAAVGYPGYNSLWKDSTASIADVLRRYGYSTAAFGKWHNTPVWEITPVGPFERWPTGKGFEYFYGFMHGMENQWEPTRLYRNTISVEAPATPAQGYHLTTDLTDEAIRWVAEHNALAPDKPYFLYFATGAVHAPHQAPREWIKRYRGRFDRGWDWASAEIFRRQKKLGIIPQNTQMLARPPMIPAWETLSLERKKLFARQMEVYAGFISHTDHEVGRLLREVQSSSTGSNTLVIYVVGDNGASTEGGPDGFAPAAATVTEQLKIADELGGPSVPQYLYANGWGWVGNTPFKYWKGVASHFGGVRNPVVISWPAQIKNVGGLRSQFTHVTDVAATLYDVIGVSLWPSINGVDQQPLDGVSFADTFSDPKARSSHHIQYYEHGGNRAIYRDGWIAAALHRHTTSTAPAGDSYSMDRWELYNAAEDFNQAHDLAKRQPGRLDELKTLFDQEARTNDVYPLCATLRQSGRPSLTATKRQFVYAPSERRIPVANIPQLDQTSYRIAADVTIPPAGAQGVLLTFGDRTNGFAWYIKHDHLVYENHAGTHHNVIVSKIQLPRGRVALAYDFTRHAPRSPPDTADSIGGTARLYVNDQLVGEEELTAVKLWSYSSTALYLGHAAGATVSEAYTPPYEFSGTIEHVKVQLR